MMVKKLRYEFYLPTCYNDGSLIEPNKYREVKNKIISKFGAVSLHPPNVEGSWIHPASKELYENVCCRFEITVDDIEDNNNFFIQLKEELKTLFQQHEIYMIATPIKQI